MVVAGGKGEGDEADRVELLGTAKGPQDDVVELLRGSEQEAAVDGPCGDLDETAPLGWHETELSTHAPLKRRKTGRRSCITRKSSCRGSK